MFYNIFLLIVRFFLIHRTRQTNRTRQIRRTKLPRLIPKILIVFF